VTPEDTISHLNQLIETSKNGELGYKTAAEHVNNTQLKTVFQEYAKQRAQFVQQLQTEVGRIGGSPAASGSLTAALHRGWIDVKSALSGGDGSALVAACETGEAAAVATYERALDMDIAGDTRTIVDQQLQRIREAHKHMLRLKETGSKAEYPKTEVGKGEG
jgi:uncharacterized protein (TIGR02284 family)